MTGLLKLYEELSGAAGVEAVFGPLSGGQEEMLGGMKVVFRRMAMVAHPDRVMAGVGGGGGGRGASEMELAEKTFRLLEMWRLRAEVRIREGSYGNPAGGTATVTTRRGTYEVHEVLYAADYATLYRCTRSGGAGTGELVFKLVREPGDNDLLEREGEVLRLLADGPAEGQRYFPEFVDGFLSADGGVKRRALIFKLPRKTVRMNQLRDAYPEGLDPRDAAWMFNRVLEGLWFSHGAGGAGVVHGAVLPGNLWVDLAGHGLVMGEWGYSTAVGGKVVAIGAGYEGWYPPEVLEKRAAGFGTDIYMAARVLVYLLGGDEASGELPAGVPAALRGFIRSCLLPAAARRPSDAGVLREEFDELLRELYGKRVYRPLAMPA